MVERGNEGMREQAGTKGRKRGQFDQGGTKPNGISGISKHARHCREGSVNWDEPEIIATFNDKNKKALQQNLLIRESLEIRRQKTSTGQGLNDPQLSAS